MSERNNITPIIKDQANCDSCWSFAATTALSYRFHLKGIKVNLSPQYALSCVKKVCEGGFYTLPTTLDLYYNGTITEECFPYSSSSGNVESCPLKCKDDSNLIKYYGNNFYYFNKVINNNEYNDIFSKIAYQLWEKDPVVSSIHVYEDLYYINQDDCSKNDYIYSYDGKSSLKGGHAIVIVGYGHLNDKYFWIIQNSYGPYFCNNGFLKIELGEIGIENVTFLEPYIEKPINISIIPIKISFDEKCNPNITLPDQFLYTWNHPFRLEYENIHNNSNNYYIYCSILEYNALRKKSFQCYQELFGSLIKGYYNFKGVFIRDQKYTKIYQLVNKTFYYYGKTIPIRKVNYLKKITYSTTNSRILFKLVDDLIIPKIYANIEALKPLSDCNSFELENINYLYCKIKENELVDFRKNNVYNYSIISTKLCGIKESIDYIVYELYTTKYPVFTFETGLLKKDEYSINGYKVELTGYIKSNINGFDKTNNYFMIQAIINDNSINNVYDLKCIFLSDLRIDNLKVDCQILYGSPFSDIKYLYFPHSEIEKEGNNIYEVIIKDYLTIIKEEEKFFK